VAAEVLGPGRGAFAAFNPTDLQGEADFLVPAEDVFVVLGGFQPGGDDRPYGRVGAGAPGDALGDSPAALQVAEASVPEGKGTAAGIVADSPPPIVSIDICSAARPNWRSRMSPRRLRAALLQEG